MTEIKDTNDEYGIPIGNFEDISDRAMAYLSAAKKIAMQPEPLKVAPTFTLSQVADLCSMEKSKASYIAMNKGDQVPTGTLTGGNRRRIFTLQEAQQWVAKFGNRMKRPEGVDAFVIAGSNFKGGSTKTTSTMSLAHGLSLLGLTVLLVDLDPQGSLTELSGVKQQREIAEEETIFPFLNGIEPDLQYAVQSCYWSGIDIIPASTAMYGAEFLLPSKQIKNPRFEFWNEIKRGIAPLKSKYDVILFDTPPSLSYMTINALVASDAIIMPMQPKGLDYASAAHFWSLISETMENIRGRDLELSRKKYDFVGVLIARSQHLQKSHIDMKNLIRETYGSLVLETEIPESAAVSTASSQFGTIYDQTDAIDGSKTYQRAREAFDSFSLEIFQKITAAWSERNEQR